MDIRVQIGKRIRELRQAKGLSQEAFALEIGLDRTYIASVENGRRNISIVNLEKIWNGLLVTPIEFFNTTIFLETRNQGEQYEK